MPNLFDATAYWSLIIRYTESFSSSGITYPLSIGNNAPICLARPIICWKFSFLFSFITKHMSRLGFWFWCTTACPIKLSVTDSVRTLKLFNTNAMSPVNASSTLSAFMPCVTSPALVSPHRSVFISRSFSAFGDMCMAISISRFCPGKRDSISLSALLAANSLPIAFRLSGT